MKPKNLLNIIFFIITFLFTFSIKNLKAQESKEFSKEFSKETLIKNLEIRNTFEDKKLLEKLMMLQANKFLPYLQRHKEYNIQIIYTQVTRDKRGNNPTLKEYTFNVNPNAYFYPASTVKLPIIALSMEKINELSEKLDKNQLDKYARMSTVAGKFCPESAIANFPNDENPPTIAKYAEQMLLVSDNVAFGRLYEFVGQKEINQKLWNKGYEDLRILRRFNSVCLTPEQSKYAQPIEFYSDNCKHLLYREEEKMNDTTYSAPIGEIKLGKAYMDDFGKLYNAPMDFTPQNYMKLKDLNDIVCSLMIPEAFPKQQRFNLEKDDYNFLKKYMSAYPKDAVWNSYPPEMGYFDAYKKYLFYGRDNLAKIDDNLKIHNIVGWAYGFLTDAAYLVDERNQIEFFLTATICINRDETFNDNIYEYAESLEFLKNLGKLIYNYERAILKKYNSKKKKFSEKTTD